MIEPGSLLGFGFVFFAITWSLSIVSCVVLAHAQPRFRRHGAAAEKRAAALALILPPLLGAVVTLSLALASLAEPWGAGIDHCMSHDHHLHLCLVHGGAWAHKIWVLIGASGLAGLAILRIVLLSESSRRIGRQVTVLARSSASPIAHGSTPVFLVASDRCFCFAAGLWRPRIFVSKRLWDSLSIQERAAMLAHERAHIEHGDLFVSVALSVLVLLGAPFFAFRAKRIWSHAAERLCDRVAADETGDAEAVATALVSVARQPALANVVAFVPRVEGVEDRVIAVLHETRTGVSVARKLAQASGLLVAAAGTLMVLVVDPLHHALETLLTLL